MEQNTSLQQQLLEAGVHFGHLKKKWNPKMLPYIFAEKKGIHIIDLNKTVEGLQEAAAALKSIAIVTNYIVAAIAEGLAERQAQKDDEPAETQDDTETKVAKFEAGSDEDRERRRRGQSGGRGPGGPGAGGPPRRRTTGGPGGGGNRPGGPGGRR